MIGLINVGPRSSASASCASDHSTQRGSSVNTSSRTFESTSVPAGGPALAIVARERHDLAGAHRHRPATTHAPRDRLPSSAASTDQPRPALVELELHLGPRLDAKPPAHRQWNGHLSLARHAHAAPA